MLARVIDLEQMPDMAPLCSRLGLGTLPAVQIIPAVERRVDGTLTAGGVVLSISSNSASAKAHGHVLD